MVKKLRIIGIFCFIGLTNISLAQWVQTGNSMNGDSGDRFGYSVSLSADGSVVAAGGIFNKENGTEAGQVKIYYNSDGNWVQKGSNINGEAADDRSGYSVSLNYDGSVVAIGAPYNEGGGLYTGHVRVFEFSDGTWKQKGQDIDGNIGDQLGNAVSLNSDGTIVAIGGSANSTNGLNAGTVKIYKFLENSWTQTGDDINGDAASDLFGISVSISADGSIVAVGASQYNNNEKGGYVKIFKLIEGNWVQTGESITGDNAKDNFGLSVSLSSDGSIMAVGAPQTNSIDGTGYAKIFRYVDGSWAQMGSTLNGKATLDWFGYSVSINSGGNMVSVGSPMNEGDEQYTGSVTTYLFFEEEWSPLADPIKGENYSSNAGYSVSLSRDSSIVAFGEPWDNAGADRAGRMRVFSKSNSVGVFDSHSDIDVTIYPNPTSGRITVNGINIEKIEVINPEGKTIQKFKVVNDKINLNLSNLPKGVFFVKVTTDKGTNVKKIIIE